MSRSVKAARARVEDGGLTQEELEDLLARVTSAQAKVTGFSDRLVLIGEQIREVRNGGSGVPVQVSWTEPGAGAPHTESAESRQ